MTYLLDTNAISDLMRAAPRIETWMARMDSADLEAKYFSGLTDCHKVSAGPSLKRRATYS